MRRGWKSLAVVVALAVVWPGFALEADAAAAKIKVVHEFGGGLIGDANSLTPGPDGGFYGLVPGDGYGAVYQMNAPVEGRPAWRLDVIYRFPGDGSGGANPVGPLVADAGGNLFGVTQLLGSHLGGTAFELSPSPRGGRRWHRHTLWNFPCGADACGPQGVVLGPGGVLFGASQGGGGAGDGTVYSLTPPSSRHGSWTETVLWSFSGADGADPVGSLVRDDAGNLFGLTSYGGDNNHGVVYELSPPKHGSQWTMTVLHSFAEFTEGVLPMAGMTQGPDGVLYGSLGGEGPGGFGTIFSVRRKGGGWRFDILYAFKGSPDAGAAYGGLLAQPDGSLLGASREGGRFTYLGCLFKLTPPAGGGGWTEQVIFNFLPGDRAGAQPSSNLVAGAGGLFGSTLLGGTNNVGTIFKLAP